MEKKLKVKTINFEKRLTFNEWVEKYKVSSAYIEPTKYFQGNPGSYRITMDTKMDLRTSGNSSDGNKQNLLGRLLSLISF